MMQIIIPTRGRADQQLTLQSLPRKWLKRTWLVCPKQESVRLFHLYGDHVEIVAEPRPDMKIAQVREWTVKECYRGGDNKILMLDDDLTFFTRKSANGTGLRKIQGEELGAEIQRLEDKLGPEFPHVGFGERLHNDKIETAGWKTPARMMYVLGYYLPIVAKVCRFDLVELREDECVTLQLLLKGHPNAVLTETVANNRETDGPGGCNTYRTDEMFDDEAEKFAKQHPGYVSVVQRDYKTSGPRKEVVVQWKKALEDGLRSRQQALNKVRGPQP
jgi:hypothetical protein